MTPHPLFDGYKEKVLNKTAPMEPNKSYDEDIRHIVAGALRERKGVYGVLHTLFTGAQIVALGTIMLFGYFAFQPEPTNISPLFKQLIGDPSEAGQYLEYGAANEKLKRHIEPSNDSE